MRNRCRKSFETRAPIKDKSTTKYSKTQLFVIKLYIIKEKSVYFYTKHDKIAQKLHFI